MSPLGARVHVISGTGSEGGTGGFTTHRSAEFKVRAERILADNRKRYGEGGV